MRSSASVIIGRSLQPIRDRGGKLEEFSLCTRGFFGRMKLLYRARSGSNQSGCLCRVRNGILSVERRVMAGAPGGKSPILKRRRLSCSGRWRGSRRCWSKRIGQIQSLLGSWLGFGKWVAGAIRLDGFELSQWDPQELGKHVGYLPQDHVELFTAGSVAENIARFGPVDNGRRS